MIEMINMDNIANFIYNLPPKNLTLLGVLLGFALIDDLSADKQNVLGNFLVLVGQVISTNAAAQDYADGLVPDKEKEQMKNDIDNLKKQMAKLNK
jgi:hypothetical protein